MWEEFFIWLNHNVNVDIRFSPEYIIFGTDHDFATGEIILLTKLTINTHLQKGRLVLFETIKLKISNIYRPCSIVPQSIAPTINLYKGGKNI